MTYKWQDASAWSIPFVLLILIVNKTEHNDNAGGFSTALPMVFRSLVLHLVPRCRTACCFNLCSWPRIIEQVGSLFILWFVFNRFDVFVENVLEKKRNKIYSLYLIGQPSTVGPRSCCDWWPRSACFQGSGFPSGRECFFLGFLLRENGGNHQDQSAFSEMCQDHWGLLLVKYMILIYSDYRVYGVFWCFCVNYTVGWCWLKVT